MSLNKLSPDEIKQLSLVDVAYILMKSKKKSQPFNKLYEEATQVLGMSNEEVEEKISLFYTSLTLDGRFVILHDGSWDLRENHDFAKVNPNYSDFDTDLFIIEEEEEEEEDEDALIGLPDEDADDNYDSKEDLKNLVEISEDDLA